MKLVVSWPATIMLFTWPTIWWARSAAPVSLLRAPTCDHVLRACVNCVCSTLTRHGVDGRTDSRKHGLRTGMSIAPGGRPQSPAQASNLRTWPQSVRFQGWLRSRVGGSRTHWCVLLKVQRGAETLGEHAHSLRITLTKGLLHAEVVHPLCAQPLHRVLDERKRCSVDDRARAVEAGERAASGVDVLCVRAVQHALFACRDTFAPALTHSPGGKGAHESPHQRPERDRRDEERQRCRERGDCAGDDQGSPPAGKLAAGRRKGYLANTLALRLRFPPKHTPRTLGCVLQHVLAGTHDGVLLDVAVAVLFHDLKIDTKCGLADDLQVVVCGAGVRQVPAASCKRVRQIIEYGSCTAPLERPLPPSGPGCTSPQPCRLPHPLRPPPPGLPQARPRLPR